MRTKKIQIYEIDLNEIMTKFKINGKIHSVNFEELPSPDRRWSTLKIAVRK